MDLKEQIIKFLNEETEQYRCTESGDCRAIGMDTKEDAEYLADELIKLFSLHSVSDSEQMTISKKEYHWLKKCEKDLDSISFSL